MIYTDRKYNKTQKLTREEQIAKMEAEHDELLGLMLDFPAMCTPENTSRLHYLASQTESMRRNDKYF